MVNDRGSKKWAGSFIMPEHEKMLQELWESENDIDRPSLSADQMNEINEAIRQAIEFRQLVNISYYDESIKRILQMKALIIGGDGHRIEVEDEEGKDYIYLDDVVDVLVSEE